MSQADDLTILNQAKALEGMRQRLRSHGKKLADRQRMIDKMKHMIAMRDERICHLVKTLDYSNSELTRKCQELEEARKVIDEMNAFITFLLNHI